MNRRRVLAGVFAALAVAYAAELAVTARLGTTFESLPPRGPCHHLEGIQGPEDLQPLGPSFLLVSSNYLPPRFPGPDRRGELLLLELSDGAPTVHRLDTSALPELRPRGISALQTAPGEFRVAVINQPPSGDRIELFQLAPQRRQLQHVGVVVDPALLKNANDLVLLAPDELLVTHDHRSTHPALKLAEGFARIGLSYVSHWKGGVGRQVLGGLDFANGITALEDGSWAVASMLGRKVLRVSWKVPGQELKVDASAKVPGFPDNLVFDAGRRRLWVAMHDKIFELKAFSEGKRATSASRVATLGPALADLRIELASAEPELAALSTAQPFGPYLVLGNVFSGHLTYCALEGSADSLKPEPVRAPAVSSGQLAGERMPP